MDQNQHLNKTAEAQPSQKRKSRCCSGFKMFFAALSFSFISKALSAAIMKSSITQIERRFDISSSVAGLIDGSFEIGNLILIVFVSYFGSKLHRPKIIGIGCIIMGIGCFLTALPHFFMGYYRYSKEVYNNPLKNSTSSLSTCLINQNLLVNNTSPEIPEKGSLFSIAMIGPILGFTLGSQLSKIYVDIGYVDLSSIRITPKDSRWVGAWWLGFLLAGLLSIISSIPFFFLSKNLDKPQKERKVSISSHVLKTNEERSQMGNSTNHGQNVNENMTGFFRSLKSILTNPLYVLFLVLTLIQSSGFIGAITYLLKYIEQQYDKSTSEANTVIGCVTLPTIATGMFVGGYIIKKFKFTLLGIAKYLFFINILSTLFYQFNFTLICESKLVAGLTLTYDGNNPVASHINVPLSYCNSDCNCDENQWEPVCGDNGITYISPCLAGCKSSSGNKKPIVFYNCSCVEATGFQNRNNSAYLGACPRDDECRKKFHIYIVLQILNSFTTALGTASTIMLLFKNVQPELKSLAMGVHSLIIRSLGGIPAPIYFGALIDKTCMKWSINSSGKQGSCRIYNSKLFGYSFWGLIGSTKLLTVILFIAFIYAMKKKYQGKDTKVSENGRKTVNEENLKFLNNYGRCIPPARADSETHM
ncbi:solute carrier organic anion transporter family member 1B3 isoform X2 [Pteropus vampyrus]|uniref:Solute carrier organic anion transporter family member n=1 Tax=Pteropus vampyrus TaxID=132908 RepID=A0A6P6BY96_PTEVA|nr:solute carrier organic anion transporter family member 1B3 isoform X2 [Pteropus vampyrus]